MINNGRPTSHTVFIVGVNGFSTKTDPYLGKSRATTALVVYSLDLAMPKSFEIFGPENILTSLVLILILSGPHVLIFRF